MKKLHISHEDKVIAGVCGGLAESTGLNANLIRGIFVFTIFFGFSGVLVYLVLLAILPNNEGKAEIIDIENETEVEGKIQRAWKNRMIAGVCAGLAKYLGWDVSIVRMIFVGMSFVAGIGIILYVFFWFLFPNEE